MARPARPWFRMYTEALSDRKIRRLTPAHRWLWVAVLGAARMSPVPGVLLVGERDPMTAEDLADIAALPLRDVVNGLEVFVEAGMIELDDDRAWCVVKWDDRQFETDNVTERTRKHRSKEQRRNVPTNAETAAEGTPPETETEADTEPVASTVVVSPPVPPTNDDDVLIEVARARAARLGRLTPATKWIAAVAASLDRDRVLELDRRGHDPSTIDRMLDTARVDDEPARSPASGPLHLPGPGPCPTYVAALTDAPIAPMPAFVRGGLR